MNPDAEEAVSERFRNAKVRLRNELSDQLQSRIESLDEEHESLEYIREKAELCAAEAKVCFLYIRFVQERLSQKPFRSWSAIHYLL